MGLHSVSGTVTGTQTSQRATVCLAAMVLPQNETELGSSPGPATCGFIDLGQVTQPP